MNRSFIYAFLFAAFVSSSLFAQIPRQISYQGFVKNADGNPVTGTHALVVKIYNDVGTLLHTENFPSAQFTDGVFTVMLGSGSGLPQSLDFTKKYFLGVTVDGGAEMSPRTEFASAPYALRAAIADAITPGGNIVTSANGLSGALRLVGAGATTVTQSHDTIFISSSGGGGASGIQGLQNGDGTMTITNPNGPVATLNLLTVPLSRLSASGAAFDQILKFNGSIWAPSNYSVISSARFTGSGTSGSPLDLAGQGAGQGNVLKWSGTAWEPGQDNVGALTLPFSTAISDAGTLFSVTNNGAGRAAQFMVNNATSNNVALYATSNGNAAAADFYKDNAAANPVLTARAGTNANGGAFAARNDGAGVTATIRTFNTNNTSNVLEVSTAGTGRAGYFQINNTGSTTYALEATSNSSGHTIYSSAGHPNASAIFGMHGGNGTGVTGTSPDGLGVFGTSVNSAGVRGVHSASLGTAAGVEGKTSSPAAGTTPFGGASGVYGEVTPTTVGAWTAGVRGYNKGTAANGVGVTGLHDGSGFGVYGETAGAGAGVMGKSTAGGYGGYFDIPGGGAGWGVYASTAAKPGGGAWAVFSDRTMKHDIHPFMDGLNIIEQINPVRYHYNGQGGMPTEPEFIGIIAQDMQPLMPYAVRQARAIDSSEKTYMSFDPSAITYIQVNAIKELSAKLDAMQQRIEQLEKLLEERGIDPGSPATGH